jgi:hypothetical protein
MSGRQPQGGSSQDPDPRRNQHVNPQGYGQLAQHYNQPSSGYAYQTAPSIQGYDPQMQSSQSAKEGPIYGKSQSYTQNQYPLGQTVNVSSAESCFVAIGELTSGTRIIYSLLTVMTLQCLIPTNIIHLNNLPSFSLNLTSNIPTLLN